MRTVERPLPPDHDEASADNPSVANDLFEAEESTTAGAEQPSFQIEPLRFQIKLAELEASNHRLLVDNVALRSSIEALKSRRSLERMVILSGTTLIWILFTFSFLSKIAASSW